jgi:hypothetical protein
MADASWRCSACGTINEPAASSCRTCGRWPSLFELEASSLEDVRAGYPGDEAAFEVEEFEPETYEVGETYMEDEAEGEEAPPSPADRRRKLLTSLIVPLAFAVYILISLFVRDRG